MRMQPQTLFVAACASVLAVTSQSVAAIDQDEGPGTPLPPWEPIVDQSAAALLVGFTILGARGAMEDPPVDELGFPVDFGDRLGSAVSAAGDFNGDGVDDLAIVAEGVMPEGRVRCGAVYVIYGQHNEPFPLELDLAGDFNGRIYTGVAEYDSFGSDLAVADFNGDGVDDLIVGAVGVSHGGGAYVLFGGHEAARLNELDGTNGMRIDGWLHRSEMGAVVAAVGDVNHDGVEDIAIASEWSSPQKRVGEVVILFGRAPGQEPFPPVLELGMLDGRHGFRVVGSEGGDAVGSAVSGGHDVNGDGIDDVVIGASRMHPQLAPARGPGPGAAAIIFGRDVAAAGAFPGMMWLDRLDDGAGVFIAGARKEAPLGSAVAIPGDMDGDGLAEIVLAGFSERQRPRDREDIRRWLNERPVGEAYVLAGRRGWPPRIDLGQQPDAGDKALTGVTRLVETNPWSLGELGDLNGDGLADLGIVMDGTVADSGVAIVLGRPGPLPATLNPRELRPDLGVWLAGDRRHGNARTVARAGDVNGDGLVDLVLGDYFASVRDRDGAGRAMVLFGRQFPKPEPPAAGRVR